MLVYEVYGKTKLNVTPPPPCHNELPVDKKALTSKRLFCKYIITCKESLIKLPYPYTNPNMSVCG